MAGVRGRDVGEGAEEVDERDGSGKDSWRKKYNSLREALELERIEPPPPALVSL